MKKDAFYFPHDSNAQHDEKILQLRAVYGWEGYGLYWAIIERLRDNKEYRYALSSIPGLAISLSYDEGRLQALLKLCTGLGLFQQNETYFWSPRLSHSMQEIDQRRQVLKESGRRGGLISSQAKALLNRPSSSKEKKSKELIKHMSKDINRNTNIQDRSKIDMYIIEEEIYSYYAKTIKPGARQDSIKNIAKLLKSGLTKEDLLGRIDAYAKRIKESGVNQNPQYYIQANNFFGEKARYRDFEPIKVVQYKTANPGCRMCKGTGKYLIQATGEVKVCECRIIK